MPNQLSYLPITSPSDDDRGTLKILGIFYSIMGGLELAGFMLILVINWHASPIPPVAMLAICLAAALSIFSGISMLLRQYRVFSFALAICMCFAFPVGTILGGWTMVVLNRPGVIQLYRESVVRS